MKVIIPYLHNVPCNPSPIEDINNLLFYIKHMRVFPNFYPGCLVLCDYSFPSPPRFFRPEVSSLILSSPYRLIELLGRFGHHWFGC